MGILFNEIVTNTRTQGTFVEFDTNAANDGDFLSHGVLLVQRLANSAGGAGIPYQVVTADEGAALFGHGSMGDAMVRAALAVRPGIRVSVIALDDLGAGVAASGSLTIAGVPSTNGTLSISIAGQSVSVPMLTTQTATTLATAIVQAITDESSLECTASSNAGVVTLTAKHKGEYGNDLTISFDVSAAEAPTSPTITLSQFSGGTGNPDINDAIVAMGDEWYNYIANPWTDAANLDALSQYLTTRFGPHVQRGSRAFMAFRGTYGESAAFGDSRNDPHFSCMMTSLSASPSHHWAAVNMIVAGSALAQDPTRQLNGRVLVGIKPPPIEQRFNDTARNQLLYDGGSTYTADANGNVRIEAQITMLQENAQGLADNSMLYIQVPEYLERHRLAIRQLFAPFSDAKLMGDRDPIPVGQKIMTPKRAKAMLIDWYRVEVSQLAWAEDIESYIERLIVEKEGNRLKIVESPDIVNNLRQTFARVELRDS